MPARKQQVAERAEIASDTRPDALRRLRRLFWGVALAAGVAAGVLIGVVQAPHRSAVSTAPPADPGPAASWQAGAKRAPDFALVDQAGKPVSIAAFRGRPVIVTFIDPLCRNLCPLEAKVLASAEASMPVSARPAIVAVSVNPWGNARRHLLEDVVKWKLTRNWHWAVGSTAALRKVWRDYAIAVQDTPKTVAGVTIHEIAHTEAAVIVDSNGYQRALYLYPYRAADVARTVRRLAGA